MFDTLIKGKAILMLASVLTMGISVSAQKSLTGQPDTPVTFLESTRKQDGLFGSVRRVKTQAAKLEIKKGKPIEGPRQLLEITAYDLAGKRVDNVSYPVATPTVGKEEYRYDDKGNVIELTLRDEDGSLLSKQRYEYEFDKFGNWAKMVTYLVVFEGGELKTEPVEVTYRALTYYFDDSVEKIINEKSEQSSSRVASSRRPLVSTSRGPNVTSKEWPKQIESEHEQNPPAGLPANPSMANRDLSRTGANPIVDLPAEPRITINSNDAGVPKNVPNPVDNQARPLAVSSAPAIVMGDKVGAPVNAASPATLNRKAFDYYKLGHQRVESGDLKGAIEAYRKSIELGTDSAELQLSLGNVYIKLKKDGDAIKALKQSIRLDPESAEAHYGLGLVHFRDKRFRDAETFFKKATVLSPDMAKARYGLALTYQELGRQDALIEEYRKLQSLDKNLANQLTQSFPEFNLPCRVPPYCK